MQSLNAIGLLQFEFVGDPVILQVYVFETSQYDGTPTESEGKIINCFQHNQWFVSTSNFLILATFRATMFHCKLLSPAVCIVLPAICTKYYVQGLLCVTTTY